jgi:ADP-ribose pyrophosphatase YjhB (NUDIX family)
MQPVVRNFCPNCASPWRNEESKCHHCEINWWRNPVPSSAGILIHAGQLLLMQRDADPYAGYWDLPGGFCEIGESPEVTLKREFEEETGISVVVDRYFGSWMDTYEDGTSVEDVRHTLNLVYLVRAASPWTTAPRSSSEGTARWWELINLPENLAFPRSTGLAIEDLLSRCKRPQEGGSGYGREPPETCP